MLDVLIKHKDSHLSIDDIYNYVKERNRTSDRDGVPDATLLQKVGAVVKLDLDDGFSRYELSRQMRTIATITLYAPTAAMFQRSRTTCSMRWRSRYLKRTVSL